MCLHKKHFLPKIATKDIPVYKVLTEIPDSCMVTPYMKIPIKFNTIIKAGRKGFWESIFDIYIVNEGFIHSYTDLLTARINENRADTIFKAIIPKGSLYFIGENNEIASTKLIITTESCEPWI